MGRDLALFRARLYTNIFQSTLPAWGETLRRLTVALVTAFQSTLPAWGETSVGVFTAPTTTISIHSPRMGRDYSHAAQLHARSHFNPLSPHGERLVAPCSPLKGQIFQSTLPAWGETGGKRTETWKKFQSTLPAWGETGSSASSGGGSSDFNPLSPHGERRGGRVEGVGMD